MEAINLKEKFNLFNDQWTPKVITNLDDNHVYLTKIEGDFVWHSHENQDELFIVVEGRFRMDFRDKAVWVEEGEVLLVPAGTEHRPSAEAECKLLVIENAGTDHTGGVDDDRRQEEHERI
ncbi:MAG: cupin domain-containing protein [Kordiimonadaceae bacterium]|jgi:mannose-6-phosphate isomerase-like protein (cupin superfamily)|nr:cupin domain-containing protein [Kordiimonadaceae bacterium]MBT6031906.1 cupin domain-containing protein [Kordiimonadaceae bacterium]